MKYIYLKAWVLVLAVNIFLLSCQEEDEIWNEDYIIAGDLSQTGLQYHDINPNASISFFGSETVTYPIDMDNNGYDDFQITRTFLHSKEYGHSINFELSQLQEDKDYLIAVDDQGNPLLLDQGDTISTAGRYYRGVQLYIERADCGAAGGCNYTISGSLADQESKLLAVQNERGRLGWIRIGIVDHALVLYDYGMVLHPEDKLNDTVGTFMGKITLYDFGGNKMPNHAGVTVEAHQENQVFSTTSDAEGVFSFISFPLGEYTLTFRKEGFSGIDTLSVENTIGTNKYLFLEMAEIPPAQIELTGTIEYDADKRSLRVLTRIKANRDEEYLVGLMYFISNTPEVSNTNYDAKDWSGIRFDENSSEQEIFSHWILAGHYSSYPPGEKIYIVAYPFNDHDIVYEDEHGNALNLRVFGEKSNVIEGIMP